MAIRDKGAYNYSVNFFTEEPTTELGLLAAKVAYYNFEWRFLTVVMFNSFKVIGLKQFLMNYEQSVIVKLGRYLPARRVAVPQMVIFGEDFSEISSTLRWTVKSKYDSNGKFIIICAFLTQDCDEVKIFQTLQSLLILNVVLLKTSQKTNKPLAYSYDFLMNGKCRNYIPYELDLYATCKNDECFKDLFPEKLSNFHQCRLVMSTIEQPPFMYLYNGTKTASGIDGEIMKLAANMLNATLVFHTPSDGSDSGSFINNNWTGSLGDIYNGRKHVSVCSTPLTSSKNGNFQISFPYYSMDIVWATRLPAQKASWEKLLYPLGIYIRIILLLLFVGIVLVNVICRMKIWYKARPFVMQPPKHSLLFYSWLVFLGMPILRTPVRRSFLTAVYTWIWFCFIIRSAYQAALINSLKQPAYLDNLKSFQDVLKEGYPYGGLASLREYYSDERAIYNNWVVLDLARLYENLDSILEGTSDFVLASTKESIKYHLMKYNRTKRLQIIPEKIVNSPTVAYYKKFSPITAPLNKVFRIALEGGFIQRTYDKYLGHDRNLFRRIDSRHPEPLHMDNFAGSFAILLLGWLLSVIYFVVEYVCGNLKD